MMNILRTVGIGKGKPFRADPASNPTYREAATRAKRYFQYLQTNSLKPYWDTGHWALPDVSGIKTEFSYQTPEMLDYDLRGMGGFMFWAPPKKSDASAPTIYISTVKDSLGRPLSGGKTYHLHVPANVPAEQYWSVTVYDGDTASFVHEASIVSLDSYNEKTTKNPDRSVDIFFSPQAPAGKQNNWVATGKGGQWFVIFRLYGPQKPFLEKIWQLPDIAAVTH
jgi:hypothetical protein